MKVSSRAWSDSSGLRPYLFSGPKFLLLIKYLFIFGNKAWFGIGHAHFTRIPHNAEILLRKAHNAYFFVIVILKRVDFWAFFVLGFMNWLWTKKENNIEKN